MLCNKHVFVLGGNAVMQGMQAGLSCSALGLGELAPLPLTQMAFVAGYAMVCTLVVNDPVKLFLLARLGKTPSV